MSTPEERHPPWLPLFGMIALFVAILCAALWKGFELVRDPVVQEICEGATTVSIQESYDDSPGGWWAETEDGHVILFRAPAVPFRPGARILITTRLSRKGVVRSHSFVRYAGKDEKCEP